MAMYPAPTGASRRYEGVLKLCLVAFLACSLPAFAMADDCTQVRFSDIGWADVTATAALAVEALKPDLLVLPGALKH